MTAEIINLQEWVEHRARCRALEHLSRWGWLPSGIEALVSLMALPTGENCEATAMKLREEVCHDVGGVAVRANDIRQADG